MCPQRNRLNPNKRSVGLKRGERQWGLGSHRGFKQQIFYVYLKGQMTPKAPKAVPRRFGLTVSEEEIESCDQNPIVIELKDHSQQAGK